MNNAIGVTPDPVNEPVKSYAPGSEERTSLKHFLHCLKDNHLEVPAFIGGQEVYTGDTADIRPPHEHAHKLGVAHNCTTLHVEQAIRAALKARDEWSTMHFLDRGSHISQGGRTLGWKVAQCAQRVHHAGPK